MVISAQISVSWDGRGNALSDSKKLKIEIQVPSNEDLQMKLPSKDQLKKNFPWTAKKGKVQYWNVVVVDNTDAQSKTNTSTEFTKVQTTMKEKERYVQVL